MDTVQVINKETGEEMTIYATAYDPAQHQMIDKDQKDPGDEHGDVAEEATGEESSGEEPAGEEPAGA